VRQGSVPEFPRRYSEIVQAERREGPTVSGAAPASLKARTLAYLVDLFAIAAAALALTVALFALGFLSFGVSWLLIVPACAAVPAAYSGITLSSPAQATLGMRVLGLTMASLDGKAIDFITGAAHALLFYVFGATMTPFILLIGLARQDRALLHDLALGVRLVARLGG
jgi:uncharacterized RDD family membrane protein YckC